MNKLEQARENLQALKENPYPGRGIIVGMDETGKFLVQVYWIMGRSENSRNRVFVMDNNFSEVKTSPADSEKVKDPSLIIYTAMASECSDTFSIHAVSNGHQTKDALKGISGIADALSKWEYEPDAPNFTPRITAVSKIFFHNLSPSIQICIIKKSKINTDSERFFYNPEIIPGLGHCITTYSGDGDPLPSFEGNPYLLPLTGNVKEVADSIWNSLNEENRVSLVAKFINLSKVDSSIFCIIDKYKKI